MDLEILGIVLLLVFLSGVVKPVLLGLVTEVEDDVQFEFGESGVKCHPQHVHIAYGDAVNEITVMWATRGNCSTQLYYGVYQWNLSLIAKGNSTEFWEQNAKGLQFLHWVKLTDLLPLATYFYRPVSSKNSGFVHFFKTPQQDESWSPEFLVFGDLGSESKTVPVLVDEALRGIYTALLHVGDIAYNLRDEEGLVGDKFMELIEPVAAYLPYMTCPGNHEIDSDTFTHYLHRFSMPQSPWPMTVDKMWYSFDVGPVHFISYSTEVFFTLNKQMVKQQQDWLKEDLTKANFNRRKRPWIVAFGHRPMYCSVVNEDCAHNDSLVRSGFEYLFYHYGVDIVLQAHEHNYERLYPVYREVVLSDNYVNPLAPIQIISGAAGNKGGLSSFQSDAIPKWSAVRIGNASLNSYGHLKVINASHAYWEQRSVHNLIVLDSLWIVQHHHGKFNASNLPGNMSRPGFGDEDDATTQNKETLKESDTTARLIIGVCFGVVFSILLAVFIVTTVCRRRRYRIVRRWNPDDFDYGQRLDSPNSAFVDDLEADFEMDSAETSLQSKKLLQGS